MKFVLTSSVPPSPYVLLHCIDSIGSRSRRSLLILVEPRIEVNPEVSSFLPLRSSRFGPDEGALAEAPPFPPNLGFSEFPLCRRGPRPLFFPSDFSPLLLFSYYATWYSAATQARFLGRRSVLPRIFFFLIQSQRPTRSLSKGALTSLFLAVRRSLAWPHKVILQDSIAPTGRPVLSRPQPDM